METNYILTGSICLSDIPKELIKRVKCKDGVERSYLNVSIVPSKNPRTFTNNDGTSRTYTHFLSCQPKPELRKEGVKYIIGDFETRTFGGGQQGTQTPAEFAQNAPQSASDDDLPF